MFAAVEEMNRGWAKAEVHWALEKEVDPERHRMQKSVPILLKRFVLV